MALRTTGDSADPGILKHENEANRAQWGVPDRHAHDKDTIGDNHLIDIV